MSENLATILTETAAKHGDRTAFKLDDVELSYSVLDGSSARLAALLKSKGLEPGDRVGLMLPNVPYFPAVYYAILRAGGIVVPMNVLLKAREVKFYVGDSGAKLLFAWHDFADAAEKGAAEAGAGCILVKPGDFEKLVLEHEPDSDVADRAADDTAVILYTSGTTGTPKGAELTHSNLRKNCEVASIALGDFGPGDTLLGALPLFHSFGQTCTMNCAVLTGARVTMLPRFDPEKALEIIERDQVTIFQGVPTMYNAMLHADNADSVDASCLRTCNSGGAAIPVELIRGFEERFGCAILEGYGLSETSPVASFNHPDKERKPGSIGTPIDGVEMKVVDEDDNFFIVDRKKDLIIRGGYNVYPREIEEVLYEHPAVQEAAVLGVPDESLGEEVGAAVVLKKGESLDADEVKSYVKEQVAAYKYPRKVWFVDDLPKGPTGKILKREIEIPEQVAAASS